MSVFKRGKHWHYAFCIRNRRYREAVPEARTKDDAQRAETRAREDVYAGRYGARRTPEFESYCRRAYIPWLTINHASATKSLSRLECLLAHFGRKRLDQITVIEVEKFKRKRLAQGRSPVTINHDLKMLKQILKHAHEAGLIPAHSLRSLKLLREPDHRQRVLTPDEEARLLKALPDGRTINVTSLRHAVVIALTTGMRQGEIYSLRWTQIDESRRTITLEQTKTARARTIPMAPQLAALFASLPRTGERVLSGRFFHHTWERALVRAGIVGLRFHDLRHTAATRLSDAGVDVFTIQSILGHSSLAMTARYSHATSERTRLAAEKLATILPQSAYEPQPFVPASPEDAIPKRGRKPKVKVA